jgi:hypothetical protein
MLEFHNMQIQRQVTSLLPCSDIKITAILSLIMVLRDDKNRFELERRLVLEIGRLQVPTW